MTHTSEALLESSREQTWREIMARWQQSGLSQQAFCEKEQLKLTTFGYWRRELKRRDEQEERANVLDEDSSATKETSTPNQQAPLFVPVEMADAPLSFSCEIVMPDGLVIRFPSVCEPDQLAQVIKRLEGR